MDKGKQRGSGTVKALLPRKAARDYLHSYFTTDLHAEIQIGSPSVAWHQPCWMQGAPPHGVTHPTAALTLHVPSEVLQKSPELPVMTEPRAHMPIKSSPRLHDSGWQQAAKKGWAPCSSQTKEASDLSVHHLPALTPST